MLPGVKINLCSFKPLRGVKSFTLVPAMCKRSRLEIFASGRRSDTAVASSVRLTNGHSASGAMSCTFVSLSQSCWMGSPAQRPDILHMCLHKHELSERHSHKRAQVRNRRAIEIQFPEPHACQGAQIGYPCLFQPKDQQRHTLERRNIRYLQTSEIKDTKWNAPKRREVRYSPATEIPNQP